MSIKLPVHIENDVADERMYVALDVPSIYEARALIGMLGGIVKSYKIGLQLLPIGGMELARELKEAGKNVFLDFKLHDIGTTVEKATRSISNIGADLLTVHARPDVMQAAAQGKGFGPLKILGVTVLTSLDDQALADIGYALPASELVMRRVEQAKAANIDGIVSSPLEAKSVRSIVPDEFLIVTPGVRMAGGDLGDQKRVATPHDALANGASHIVIGRPINSVHNPREAALNILRNIRGEAEQ